jgi:hypothetical protein
LADFGWSRVSGKPWWTVPTQLAPRRSVNALEVSSNLQRPVVYKVRPNSENLRANFLARFNEHYLSKPSDEIFEHIYQEDPRLYFQSLVQLAKVLRIEHEHGKPGAFDDRPRPREEALAELEKRAGTDARKLFEAFLKKIDKLEELGRFKAVGHESSAMADRAGQGESSES